MGSKANFPTFRLVFYKKRFLVVNKESRQIRMRFIVLEISILDLRQGHMILESVSKVFLCEFIDIFVRNSHQKIKFKMGKLARFHIFSTLFPGDERYVSG